MKKMQISMELWNFWRESNDRFLREEGTSSENEATTGEPLSLSKAHSMSMIESFV